MIKYKTIKSAENYFFSFVRPVSFLNLSSFKNTVNHAIVFSKLYVAFII